MAAWLTIASVGCMNAADQTAALTGERPSPGDESVILPPAEPDEGPPEPEPDAPVDVLPPIEDACAGESGPFISAEGTTVCCPGPGADEPPCSGAPAGLAIDAGWAFMRDGTGEGWLVMTEPLDFSQWCAIEDARLLHTDTCAEGSLPVACEDGSAGLSDPSARGVSLYEAAAFANTWSCIQGLGTCYDTGTDLLRLEDVGTRVDWSVHLSPAPCGARLLTDAQYAAMAGAEVEGLCGDCNAETLVAADRAMQARTGMTRWFTGHQWVWPAGMDRIERSTSIPLAGCGLNRECLRGDPCGPYRTDPPGLADGDIARRAVFRLVCPLPDDGMRSRCTEPVGTTSQRCLARR